MEHLGQDYGFILYRTRLRGVCVCVRVSMYARACMRSCLIFTHSQVPCLIAFHSRKCTTGTHRLRHTYPCTLLSYATAAHTCAQFMKPLAHRRIRTLACSHIHELTVVWQSPLILGW